MRRILMVLAAPLIFAQASCLAAAAGYGIARATEGGDVYVCQDAPNSTSLDAVQRMIEEDADDGWASRAGDQVDVQQRRTVDLVVDGSEQRVEFAFVESENVGRAYWISLDALCSGD